MTIRTKTFAAITVHAGSAEELAALAQEYAAGTHGRVTEQQRGYFEKAAKDLADGFVVASANAVRFWSDAPDGSPFDGNRDYRPDPDPEWAAAEAERKARQS